MTEKKAQWGYKLFVGFLIVAPVAWAVLTSPGPIKWSVLGGCALGAVVCYIIIDEIRRVEKKVDANAALLETIKRKLERGNSN